MLWGGFGAAMSGVRREAYSEAATVGRRSAQVPWDEHGG